PRPTLRQRSALHQQRARSPEPNRRGADDAPSPASAPRTPAAGAPTAESRGYTIVDVADAPDDAPQILRRAPGVALDAPPPGVLRRSPSVAIDLPEPYRRPETAELDAPRVLRRS